MKIEISKTRAAFVLVYVSLGVALLAASYGAGRGTGYLRIKHVPSYCKTLQQFNACMVETAMAAGAPKGVKVDCHSIPGERFACDIRTEDPISGPTCYAATASRAKEGFPILGVVNELPSCA